MAKEASPNAQGGGGAAPVPRKCVLWKLGEPPGHLQGSGPGVSAPWSQLRPRGWHRPALLRRHRFCLQVDQLQTPVTLLGAAGAPGRDREAVAWEAVANSSQCQILSCGAAGSAASGLSPDVSPPLPSGGAYSPGPWSPSLPSRHVFPG